MRQRRWSSFRTTDGDFSRRHSLPHWGSRHIGRLAHVVAVVASGPAPARLHTPTPCRFRLRLRKRPERTRFDSESRRRRDRSTLAASDTVTKAALARCGLAGNVSPGASELCPRASRVGDLFLQRGVSGVGEAREHLVVHLRAPAPWRPVRAARARWRRRSGRPPRRRPRPPPPSRPSSPSVTPLLTSALATCSRSAGLGGVAEAGDHLVVDRDRLLRAAPARRA